MTQPRELIRFEKVEKRYGRKAVLKVDFLSLYDGDRIVLSGPNGSGKSTLLKLLAGIAPADDGTIWRSPDLAEGRLGFVPQHGGLYGELTLEHNLQIRRNLYGLSTNDALADDRSIRELGLAPLLSKPFSELSGGYQRLAAVAAALQVEPNWLLLDEPFAGVDHANTRALLDDLVERAGAVRLLVVAGPTRESFPQASRTLMLEGGAVQCSAP